MYSTKTRPRPIVVPAVGEETSELKKRKDVSEFELNLGHCIDTLNGDLPYLFDREFQDHIFTRDIELRDPSGVQLQGKQAYRQVFAMIRGLKRLTASDVESTYRLRYNDLHRRIEVRWHSKWSSSAVSFYVDCISHYYVRDDGLINKHVVDNIDVNSRPLDPPYNSWLALRIHMLNGLQPAFFQPAAAEYAASAAKEEEEQQGEGAVALASSDDLEVTGRESSQTTPAFVANFMPQKCENVWDCDAPQSCCDFGFFKACCSAGVPAFQPIPIPVPVENIPPRRNDF
mmetsp:Transcript_8353/g.27361  ORF Transcript_8353/g.27361 Transcript_8353/m.27361 type:complete len:286 (-) Transcript_8353:806-1663(-)